MQINWKLKSCLYSIIDAFNLYGLLYFIQKYITKRSEVNIGAIKDSWMTHERNLAALNKPVLIEFGAGKNLGQNIYLSQFCEKQFVVDLFPMLDIKQFNEAANQLSALVPQISFFESANISDINNAYSIEYIAPFDMTNAPLDDNCIDCCVSTNTMEHIPKNDLIQILSELRRVIRNDGIISAKIDYSDHYSHTDKKIGRLNFLSFSEEEWKRYNHKSHYLNRLRHYDYQKIFTDLGFEIEIDKPYFNAALPASIANNFDKFNPTINATSGVYLLRVKK